MIDMMLSTAAQSLQAEIIGNDVRFRGCSTDSRIIKAGEMFIALRGEHYDGHDFIGFAQQAGAVAAMVESYSDQSLPLIQVADSRKLMGQLAGLWRNNFKIPVIAITGSNGKTTVKEMVTNILSLQAPVLSTHGNLNNEIGVPLTLFGIDHEHRFAVIEMGASHAREISYLSNLAKPTVALITQCAPAHLEGFGSVESIAKAKAEIFEGLPGSGTAIINNDDDYADFWRKKTSGYQQISFGVTSKADVCVSEAHINADAGNSYFRIITTKGSVEVTLNLPGKHNIQNALASAACCLAVDIPLEIIKKGLERTQSSTGRLQIKKGIHGACIFDDTYNANPVSLGVAMSMVAERSGRHWLVLGDMGELGADAHHLHTDAGEKARELGFERLYALGQLSKNAVAGFGNGAKHFPDADSLIQLLKTGLDKDVTLLVKGSRIMAMEHVVKALTEGN